jgi:prepilin peptidase CpaA
MPLPIVAALVLLLAACVATDVGWRRIPNLVSGPAIVVGLALNARYFGADGLAASLAGLAGATAVLVPPFALGGLGGGDVKMMAAVGALVGPRLALSGTALGMLLGGLLMLCHLARRGRLPETFGRMHAMLAAAALARSLAPLRASAADPRTVALPYSVPLALGTLAALAAGGGAWRLAP